MGPSEIEFFQQYNDALGEYMRTVKLDLTLFVEPPKEAYMKSEHFRIVMRSFRTPVVAFVST